MRLWRVDMSDEEVTLDIITNLAKRASSSAWYLPSHRITLCGRVI